ncbi:MAG: 50S ribosomal protein L29 [Planctomycetota bacterium]
MRVSEIRDLAEEDLRGEIAKLHAQLFKFRFNSTNDEMQRAGEIRGARRDIARIKTVLRERQIAAEKAASTKENSNGDA